MFFNEKQKCLYRVFNENTKCLLFHFLNALFSGLFALLCQAPMYPYLLFLPDTLSNRQIQIL